MQTAEFVTPHHPDKMCDRIADKLVAIAMAADPNARCAFEITGSGNHLFFGGETSHDFDTAEIEAIAKEVTGQDDLVISIAIGRQSAEIASGVDTGGAGDQGIMVGYACRDNPNFMPMEYELARSLCAYIYSEKKVDGKTQITMHDGKILAIVASFQNTERKDLQRFISKWLVMVDRPYDGPELYCNPCGDWKIGGFEADAGTVGRKIVMDAYGPRVPVGGGAFSGKDPTKVDRSAAYAARHAAVSLLQRREYVDHYAVKVEIAYAIGKKYPLQAQAIFYSKAGYPQAVRELEEELFTPENIIEKLGLREFDLSQTSSWGHFGNNFPWDTNRIRL